MKSLCLVPYFFQKIISCLFKFFRNTPIDKSIINI